MAPANQAEAVIRAEKDWMRRIFVALTGDGRLGAEVYLLYEGAMVAHTVGGWEDAIPIARAAANRVVNGDRASAGAPSRDHRRSTRSAPALLPPPAQQQDERGREREEHDDLAERRGEPGGVALRQEKVHTGHGTQRCGAGGALAWATCDSPSSGS